MKFNHFVIRRELNLLQYITVLTSFVKKSKMKPLEGVFFFRNTREKFKLNLVPVLACSRPQM